MPRLGNQVDSLVFIFTLKQGILAAGGVIAVVIVIIIVIVAVVVVVIVVVIVIVIAKFRCTSGSGRYRGFRFDDATLNVDIGIGLISVLLILLSDCR